MPGASAQETTTGTDLLVLLPLERHQQLFKNILCLFGGLARPGSLNPLSSPSLPPLTPPHRWYQPRPGGQANVSDGVGSSSCATVRNRRALHVAEMTLRQLPGRVCESVSGEERLEGWLSRHNSRSASTIMFRAGTPWQSLLCARPF